jgi:hypothetical protein
MCLRGSTARSCPLGGLWRVRGRVTRRRRASQRNEREKRPISTTASDEKRAPQGDRHTCTTTHTYTDEHAHMHTCKHTHTPFSAKVTALSWNWRMGSNLLRLARRTACARYTSRQAHEEVSGIRPVAHSLTHALTHSLTDSLTHSLAHSAHPPFTHPLAHPPARRAGTTAAGPARWGSSSSSTRTKSAAACRPRPAGMAR